MGADISADGTSSDDSYLRTHAFPLHFLRSRTQPVRHSLEATLADLDLSPNCRSALQANMPSMSLFDLTSFGSARPPRPRSAWRTSGASSECRACSLALDRPRQGALGF